MRFSLSLPDFFYLIDPKSDLILKAHVMDVDTKILVILLPVFGLKISGREDEFLPYWEKYGDASEGWTKIFLKQWFKKPIEVQSNNHALVLSTVSSKKRKSQSAENVFEKPVYKPIVDEYTLVSMENIRHNISSILMDLSDPLISHAQYSPHRQKKLTSFLDDASVIER